MPDPQLNDLQSEKADALIEDGWDLERVEMRADFAVIYEAAIYDELYWCVINVRGDHKFYSSLRKAQR